MIAKDSPHVNSDIKHEMEKSYLEYAMSVIISRAIPDVRDGLKPVHRRIIYSMFESGCHYDKAHKKSARIVGEVMGKYHPHGDQAIYDSLVRMAQDFSMGAVLVDGQGNFGSRDRDKAAAMRYTESRLRKLAHELIEDIDYDTVDFRPNYDGSEKEPTVLPAKFPNILVNGSEGIAVGMATSIPPHNLGEVIDACIHLVRNPEATLQDIIEIVPAPDFPTAGFIIANDALSAAMSTGRGSVRMKSKTEIEEMERGKSRIVITEIPYQVVKSDLVEAIAGLVRDKKIDGITDIRDESNKNGIRVVVELRKDVEPNVILNQLFVQTQLQVNFSSNILALKNNRPENLNIKDILDTFLEFRENTIIKRTKYHLDKAKNEAHTLIGLTVAVDFIDEVVAIIRGSKSHDEARETLLAKKWNATKVSSLIDLVSDKRNFVKDGKFSFTLEQVRAILEMRLARLTGLERDRIVEKLKALSDEIDGYIKIISNREILLDLMISEFADIKAKFAVPRRSIIIPDDSKINMDSLIQQEDIIVSYTANGYIKRDNLASYNTQRRGGKGKSGMKTSEDDVISDIFSATTHSYILFFSNLGRVYELRGYNIPHGNQGTKGRALVNLINMKPDEKIANFLPLPDSKNTNDTSVLSNLYVIFGTKLGVVKKNRVLDFLRINSNGKIAIDLRDGDELIGVKLASDTDHIMLSSYLGKSVRFEVGQLRTIKSRDSYGVGGMNLDDDDRVISLDIVYGVREEVELRDEYLRIPLEIRKSIAAAVVDVQGDLLNDSLSALKSSIAEKQINIKPDIAQNLAKNEEFILTITELGYGKRTSAYEYRVTSRGGKGVKNITRSEKNGNVVASFVVKDDDDIILASSSGKVIRCNAGSISVFSRSAQGVKVISTDTGEKVVSVTKVVGEPDSANTDIATNDNESITPENK